MALFDSLATVRSDELFGRWRGSEVLTDHPLNGLLGPVGWYGKEFLDQEAVHPLLFQDAQGTIFSVDPRKMPTNLPPGILRRGASIGRRLLGLFKGLVSTTLPRARLRNLEYRGKVSATMIYDHLPIMDTFRRVDEDTLLGVMDRRGFAEPFFFVLRRDKTNL